MGQIILFLQRWHHLHFMEREFRFTPKRRDTLQKFSTYCSLILFMYLFTLCLFWEKAMAPHSSPLAWKIPWTEEPGGLKSMGSLRVRHGWVTSLSFFTFMHWRRKWQPTPVFLPGESRGWGSLAGCHLRGLTESDTTEST